MLELIGWIQHGELMDKLTSPLFWAAFISCCIAGWHVGGALDEIKRRKRERQ
jgi:hypothetical protein